MDKKEKDFATYKEFGKMLREVADLCAKYGDTPLYESVPELKERYSLWSIEVHTMPISTRG